MQREEARQASRLLQVVFAGYRRTGRLELDAVETLVRGSMHRARAEILGRLLSAPSAEARQARCACGHRARYHDTRSQQMLTAGQLFPNEEQARKQWAAICLGQLDEGEIQALVKTLRDLRPSTEKLAEAADNDADYFGRNTERMRYPEFRAQGLFVGSGVIEAGCTTVIGARLKQSGMPWSVRGANATIALRCCRLSGRFEDDWESRSRAA